ncbi:MAG: hemerythrin domain-containing protein [Leptothrix sp. (in: b-proteobacteria)]
MSQSALKIIHAEHDALSAMLSSLTFLLAHYQRARTAPDFSVLRSMLFYIDEFPERLHHRKETELLFPMIRARGDEVDEALDKLDRDHAAGERNIRELEHKLLAWEMLGEARHPAFEQALTRYIDFYRAHMALEEQTVLPAALRLLNDADWQVLNTAFESNRDPLTGHTPDAEYEALFSRIVRTAPAPIGLGDPT